MASLGNGEKETRNITTGKKQQKIDRELTNPDKTGLDGTAENWRTGKQRFGTGRHKRGINRVRDGPNIKLR